MSRSVMIPTSFRCSSTTGTAPQGSSHMILAAALRGSEAWQLLTSLVMTSLTLMAGPFCERSAESLAVAGTFPRPPTVSVLQPADEPHDVEGGDDAQDLLLLHHQQAVDPLARHALADLLDPRVGRNPFHARGHPLADRFRSE